MKITNPLDLLYVLEKSIKVKNINYKPDFGMLSIDFLFGDIENPTCPVNITIYLIEGQSPDVLVTTSDPGFLSIKYKEVRIKFLKKALDYLDPKNVDQIYGKALIATIVEHA